MTVTDTDRLSRDDLSQPLLEVENMAVCFDTFFGEVRAVDGISFEIARGETLGLVGESGCGKTMTALALMSLVPSPGRIAGGIIRFKGRDLTGLGEAERRSLRGREMGIVFQDPMTSLDPVFTIGSQLVETLRVQRRVGKAEARDIAIDLLADVGLPSPADRLRDYPHHLSGGMRQRVMIALALAGRPDLLIADEPTTALDVTIQAQILELLARLREEYGSSLLLVTHDLGVIAQMASRVAVMYAGKIMEHGPLDTLFYHSENPYARSLLRSIVRPDRSRGEVRPIPGRPPGSFEVVNGCPFNPRCDWARPVCREVEPPLTRVSTGSVSMCHFAGQLDQVGPTQVS